MNKNGEYSRVCQFPFHDIALDMLSSFKNRSCRGLRQVYKMILNQTGSGFLLVMSLCRDLSRYIFHVLRSFVHELPKVEIVRISSVGKFIELWTK